MYKYAIKPTKWPKSAKKFTNVFIKKHPNMQQITKYNFHRWSIYFIKQMLCLKSIIWDHPKKDALCIEIRALIIIDKYIFNYNLYFIMHGIHWNSIFEKNMFFKIIK